MKTGTALVTALLALTSFPLLAQQPSQQPSPASPPANPAAQQNPPEAAPSQPATAAASPNASSAASSAAVMSPVNGELVSKLDSKTAKTGDNVVVQTKASVKTADGTEIPKGSKLMGHVVAVKPSGAGETSQVALQIDHVELKGGQSLAVHSQIQSIAPPATAASDNGSAAMPGAMPSTATPGTGMSGPPASGSRASATSANGSNTAAGAPQGAAGATGAVPAGGNIPAAGTVVATNGNIAIRTTSIPGILLANNEPGQQDPRMAQASSILLGAKQDIQLEGGTQMVIGLAAAGGGTQ